MKMKRHCDLCQHQVLSIERGSVCGVTNKKPDFNRTCIKIRFDKKLKGTLEDVIIDYEELKQTKNKVYIKGFFDLILGFFIVLCGYFLWKYFLNQDYNYSLYYVKLILVLPVIILSVGFVLINKGLNTVFSFRKNLKLTNTSKASVDEVLNLYDKKYSYSIDFEKEIHGIQNVEIKIKFS